MKSNGLPLALSAAVILAATLACLKLGLASGLPLYLIAIAVSAFRGGMLAGLVSTLVVEIIVGIYFLQLAFPREFQIQNLFPMVFLVLEGIFVSWLFESIIKTDLIKEHQLVEKELQSRISDLARKLEETQREIKARDEFLSIASHELKTPLTSMLLQLQIALHNIRNVSLANFSVENLLKMLESAEGQTKRLSKMINDLLNVSLITTGRMDLEVGETDLVKVTREVIERFGPKLSADGYKLQFDAPPEIVGIWDKLRLEQAIANLISNAIKYGTGNPIEVRVKSHNSQAEVVVRDRGIGMTPEQMKKIFGLFERAAPNSGYRGLGVGLYISQQIVKAHGGKIKVTSHPGEGSSFALELPLKHAPKAIST